MTQPTPLNPCRKYQVSALLWEPRKFLFTVTAKSADDAEQDVRECLLNGDTVLGVEVECRAEKRTSILYVERDKT